MNSEEEMDFHLNQCEQCLQNAWSILNNINEELPKNGSISPSKLISPAFQFLLIEYSKPYTRSAGIHKNYILSEEFVPEKYMDLHKKIINSRHQVNAHHDLTILEAKCIEGYDNMYIMNKSFPTELIKHIDSIKNLIEQSIDNIQKKIENKKNSR